MATRINTLNDVLSYLSAHTDYERQLGGRTRETFDLDRMVELLNAAGRPDLGYPCAHIAGTKGKGSTSRFLAAALASQGLKVGLYTSPHLERLNERIEVGGREISDKDLVKAFRTVVKAREKGPGNVTFFEVLTLAAMVAFAQAKVEVAVFEVGLGGRLDATNVVNPLVTVITEIGLDHTQQLGDTIEEIAREKAGIIKPGVPVVCGAQLPEAQRVISLTARDEEAPLIVFGKDYEARAFQREGRMIHFTAAIREHRYDVRLNNPARFMADNACHALCALEVMASDPDIIDVLDREKVSKALFTTPLPGRFEIFGGAPTIVIDSAHNELSLKASLATARALNVKGPVVLVAGIARDKDVEACAGVLAGADACIFTGYNSPRASDPRDLITLYQKFGGRAGSIGASPQAAFQNALGIAGKSGLVLVTGSTYLAGELRALAREVAGV
ncbi:MAG: bifunctional folylpolyglutamate synthase/dihydrofolate synthase [Planctomycetes bacterium]|nr:bifunctional folylpolyglutamate synthase/dihydrofolate synthase [Planctomycetota bacterium]